MIRRLNLSETQIQYLFLNTINLARIQTRRWKYRLPVIFSDADEDVAAVQVMEVIGESTERVQYSQGFHPCLNSSLSDSTMRACRTSSMLTGRVIESFLARVSLLLHSTHR
jgi:hypothetical protein